MFFNIRHILTLLRRPLYASSSLRQHASTQLNFERAICLILNTDTQFLFSGRAPLNAVRVLPIPPMKMPHWRPRTIGRVFASLHAVFVFKRLEVLDAAVLDPILKHCRGQRRILRRIMVIRSLGEPTCKPSTYERISLFHSSSISRSQRTARPLQEQPSNNITVNEQGRNTRLASVEDNPETEREKENQPPGAQPLIKLLFFSNT